jgi:hypothetical protein
MHETYEGEWEGQELAGEEEFQEQEWGGEMGEFAEAESPLGEVAETELAMELLEVGSEAELEQFLGNLFKRVGRAAGKFMNSSTGRALGGVLKNVAKKALPLAGGALGSIVPGVGTAIGSTLGSMASRLFEVELETLGEEEAEFEAARRCDRSAHGAPAGRGQGRGRVRRPAPRSRTGQGHPLPGSRWATSGGQRCRGPWPAATRCDLRRPARRSHRPARRPSGPRDAATFAAPAPAWSASTVRPPRLGWVRCRLRHRGRRLDLPAGLRRHR